jgi:hypothetical protein
LARNHHSPAAWTANTPLQTKSKASAALMIMAVRHIRLFMLSFTRAMCGIRHQYLNLHLFIEYTPADCDLQLL